MGEKQATLTLKNYKPLREVVFETLREAILNGTLKPGQRLMETQLAAEMGVSRTPIREAIRKLELEGLVVMIPRRGTYVASMSRKDIVETFEIRTALEALAVKLAVQRITSEELAEMRRICTVMEQAIAEKNLNRVVELDEAFHDIIFSASRNDRLAQIISLMREQIKRFRRATLSQENRQRLILGEHIEIMQAISDGNSSLAHELVVEHITKAEHALLDVVSDNQIE